MLVDLHDLRFIDCAGTRALTSVIGTVAPSRAIEVHGCQRAVSRVMDLLGLDLERGPGRSREDHDPQAGGGVAGLPRRMLRAQAGQARVHAQQVASYASVVMARLAATYEALATTSCLLAHQNADEVSRLRELSQRARDLSTRYRHCAVTARP